MTHFATDPADDARSVHYGFAMLVSDEPAFRIDQARAIHHAARLGGRRRLVRHAVAGGVGAAVAAAGVTTAFAFGGQDKPTTELIPAATTTADAPTPDVPPDVNSDELLAFATELAALSGGRVTEASFPDDPQPDTAGVIARASTSTGEAYEMSLSVETDAPIAIADLAADCTDPINAADEKPCTVLHQSDTELVTSRTYPVQGRREGLTYTGVMTSGAHLVVDVSNYLETSDGDKIAGASMAETGLAAAVSAAVAEWGLLTR